MSGRKLLLLVALGAALKLSACVGPYSYGAGPEEAAMACARASEKTDTAIVDCFTAAGLPAPEDLT